MAERLTIAFADKAGAIQGVAITGAGTLLRLGEQLTMAPPPAAAPPEEDGGPWRITAPEGYELAVEPLGRPAALEGDTQVSLCRVSGSIGAQPLDGLGTLSRAPAGHSCELERFLSIWFDAQLGFALVARRGAGASGHGEEHLEAVVFRGEPLEPATIELPRLSTTYDSAGLATHAGIELWETTEAEFAVRIGGEAHAHGELADPDGARSSIAFVGWHHNGHRGSGSYTITTCR
jgi:hypothetical protein